MIYWLGLITFLVAQMAEILVWAISQHDKINSQLPYQNMRGLFLGKRLHSACTDMFMEVCLLYF